MWSTQGFSDVLDGAHARPHLERGDWRGNCWQEDLCLMHRGKDASSLPGEEAGFGQLGHGSREGLWKFSFGIGLSLGDVGIL